MLYPIRMYRGGNLKPEGSLSKAPEGMHQTSPHGSADLLTSAPVLHLS